MRKLREILKLHFENKLSNRQVGTSCHVSPSTVADYVGRAVVAKLGWPPDPLLDDEALERLLFPYEHGPVRLCPEPDYSRIHLELMKKHVTKALLWQEYRDQHHTGYEYSQFFARYGVWEAGLSVTMRQSHKAGEKMFVDFSGDGVVIVDPRTGYLDYTPWTLRTISFGQARVGW